MLGTASQGLKTSVSFFSILPPPPPPHLPSLSPSLPRSPISSLEISLRRLSAGKLVTSAGLRQQPGLTTEGGGAGVGGEAEGFSGGGGVSEPGEEVLSSRRVGVMVRH